MNSKFIGMKFDGWQVYATVLKNSYKKNYNNGKLAAHNAYDYCLFNLNNPIQTLRLSGNTVRRMFNGTRSLAAILSSTKSGRNAQLVQLRKTNK